MNTILVTGCAGFIGSHLSEALLQQGHTVVGIDCLDSFYPLVYKKHNLNELNKFPTFTFNLGDISDLDFLSQIFSKQKIDMVIHLAAKAGVRNSALEPAEYITVNEIGTVNILQTMRLHGINKMVYASSSSVYGEQSSVPFSESNPVLSPVSIYANTKISGELLCKNYCHLYNFDISCLRFFTVYGPRQRPEMAIHNFTSKIVHDLPITVYGDGSSSRDYTYVDDIVDGIIGAHSALNGFNIFNIGNSYPVKLSTLIETIEVVVGKKAKLNRLPMGKDEVDITYADISKAQQSFGYQPHLQIADGIQRFYEWYLANKHWMPKPG